MWGSSSTATSCTGQTPNYMQMYTTVITEFLGNAVVTYGSPDVFR